jgi:predicted DNA-binding transcriptional regulator AlpA
MPKRTNQEKALLALLETSSIAEASVRSGLSQETIYRYLRDKAFQKEFREARRATVDAAISALQQATSEAVDTLKRNMRCENSAVEVRSAQIILEMSFKGIEMADILDRLEILENEHTK